MSGKYSEQFEQFFNYTRKVSKLCGVDIISDDYKYSWRTAVIFFLLNIGVGFAFYTIYIDIFINSTPLSVLPSLAVLGTGIQGYVKFLQIFDVYMTNTIRGMHHEISDIYVEYENKTLIYKNELRSSLMKVKKVLSALFTMVSIAALLIIGVPFLMLVVMGKRRFILNLFLPYLDVETTFGYYSTFLLHAIFVFFAGFGNFIYDSWCFIYVTHVTLFSNLLKCKFHDLDNILEAHPNDKTKSMPLLLDILKWHQKYNIFSEKLKTIYFWPILVEIATSFVSIICTILCIFLDLWPEAPVFLIYSFALIYSYCFLGNIVEVANDDVIDYIYDSKWYLLTVPEQKMILTMLRYSQQATSMTVGGVIPLTMNTALQMSKTIYTMSMLLREFFNN